MFGGPNSNLEATEALLAEAARLGVPPQRVICTGDVVAYCADPVATVRLVREAGIHVVMGNCEESLAADADDCGCGFAEGSTCAGLSGRWYAYARKRLSEADRAWMAALPRRIDFRMAGRRLTVVHGTPSTINRYVFASTPAAEKLTEIAGTGSDGVICGHCGLPFSELIPDRAGSRLWLNAGAIGVPANDGTPRVWYALLSPSTDGILAVHRPLAYDHRTAAAKMRANGLPEEYAQALETGLWDNCDVLPSAETQAQGQPLAPPALTWPHRSVEGAMAR